MAFSQTENPALAWSPVRGATFWRVREYRDDREANLLESCLARCPLCPDSDQILQRSEMSPSARLGHSPVFRLIAADITGVSMIWKVSPPAENRS
jgi:hypothetical protein